ncbi:MAG: formate--tetrahydrofolate ligase, partial [Solobacterium sp.]|nr:formate--tetrahydrofolate ligase [Solobacterium sp.]
GGVEQEDLTKENVEAMLAGAENLAKHVDSIQHFGVPFIIAINKFSADTEKEVAALKNWCAERGFPVELSDGWARGGDGTIELAEKVVALCDGETHYAPIYDENEPIKAKILKIAQTIYGADDVEYSELAEEKIKIFMANGWDHMPVCMAKTQMSLSDNDKVKGRPRGFNIHVQDLSVSAGAGFLVAYTGTILTMPGLPKVPAAINMGVDENGDSFGIF